jgi:hypothetical protein
MITPSDDEFEVRNLRFEQMKGFDHEFEPLVRTPFSKRQNAMCRRSAPGKVREFRPASKQTMGAEMNIVTTVFVIQDLAVSGHQHRDGIRQEKHSRGYRARYAIQALMTHAHILELNCVHQVVQGHVRVPPRQSRKQRRHEAAERDRWISAERAEQQIEPDHIGLQLPNVLKEPISCSGIIE